MQTGLLVFDIIAKINRVDIDLRKIQKEYAVTNEELSEEELVRIIKNNDFKVKIKYNCDINKFVSKYPVPAIMLKKDGSYAVLLKVNPKEEKALIFGTDSKIPEELTYEEIKALCGYNFIILSHKFFNSQIKFGFKWFFQEIMTYKLVITEVLIGSFIVQLFGLVTPLFTQVILDKVIVHRTITTLNVLAFAFVAVCVFELFLNLSRKYIFTHTVSKIDSKLGAKLFRHLFALPFPYFESRKVGNIIARVRELDQIRDFITNKSVTVIIDVFFSFVFVVMMLFYSLKLTLIVIGFVGMIAALYLLVTPELRRRLENKFQMGAQSNSYLVESVTGIQTVKSLAIEGPMQRHWEDYLGNYVKSGFQLSNMSNSSSAIAATLQRLMTIAILYAGVKLVIENKLTIGQLIAFQMFSNQFTGPILRLVNLWNELQQALLGIDRLGDILNNPIELHSPKAITLSKINGNIKFDNVSFKYNIATPNVLENFSIEIKAGTKVGLIGKSGSGKSTITKLIQRLYLINEGAVYIDGIDIRHMNPYWLRQNIGVVLQESYLFSGTIRDNIAMPMQSAPIEAIIQAAKIAGADEFISQLPEGYETMVGERGSTLSGGQRQRIAIARALISNPKILIFDEATSALDYESERVITDNLEKITQNRTTFIIAHRLSTVQKCDIIVALDRGKIVETGTHEELLAKKGYYYSLYSAQTINC